MRMLKRLVLLASVLIGAGAYYYFGLSRDAWRPPFVVKIQSETDLAALGPTWGGRVSDAEKGESQGLLLRDGDYFFAENVPLRYVKSDGQALTMTFSDWGVQLGATIVAVMLDKEGGTAWLNNATERQLADVRTVGLPSEIDAGTLSALKRLAAVNPNVDLGGESGAAFLQVLPLFQPRAVFLAENASPEAVRALANQPKLDTLLIEASEPGSLDVLPTLPKLRHLIIGKWDVPKAGPLPAGLSGLKSLLVIEADTMKDLKVLDAAPDGLQELSLIAVDNLTDLTGLDRMTALRTLVLWNDEITDLSSLAGLKNLRWVGLPPKTSQEQFASFVSAHPDLTILDMTGNDAVSNLAALSAFKGLQGLILDDGPYENLDAVQGLSSLRFLGISKKTASPEQVAAIRKALPDALVVRLKPVCLGSGWILLLVPVMVGVWLLRRQPRRAGQPA